MSPAFSGDRNYDSCDNGVVYSRCDSESPDYASSEALFTEHESSYYDYAAKEDGMYASATVHRGVGKIPRQNKKARPMRPDATSHYSLASAGDSKIKVRLDSNQLERLDSIYQVASEALGDENLDDLEWEADAAAVASPVEDFFEMFKSPSPRLSQMSPKALYTRGSPVLGGGGPGHPGAMEAVYDLASPPAITSPLGCDAARRRPMIIPQPPEPVYSSAGTNAT
jgi:hypothetical protein